MLPKFHVVGNLFFDAAVLLKPIALILIWFAMDYSVKKIFRRGFSAAASRLHGLAEDDLTRQSMEYRLKTIRQLSTELTRVVVAVIMGFWFLGSLGIDLRPVIAGLGVAGLGLGLAAQNMIRDFINGFLILVEDQYNVGDWIEVGGYQGTVDRFTLRATRLRDLEGNLVIIPNNTIQTVVNYTKEWSIAVIKVGITYESDYKKARAIMEELGKTMAEEDSSMILDTPSYQGITDFAANSINMRLLIKTIPGKQWNVSRLYRERLVELFDAAGIDFAYPQIVVHKAAD